MKIKKIKNIYMLIVLVACVTLLSGCSLTKLSREKFRSILESEKYEVLDVSDTITSSFTKSYDTARNNSQNIEIHFYTYKNSKYAKDIFNEYKRNMVESKKYMSAESNAINWINYSSYTLRTNTTFDKIVYKYDTFIKISATAEKTSVAEAILKKLGF